MPTLKGTEGSFSYIRCFLFLISSSIIVSIFHKKKKSRILYKKLSFKCVGEIRTFPDKQKLRECIAKNLSILQKMLKEVILGEKIYMSES